MEGKEKKERMKREDGWKRRSIVGCGLRSRGQFDGLDAGSASEPVSSSIPRRAPCVRSSTHAGQREGVRGRRRAFLDGGAGGRSIEWTPFTAGVSNRPSQPSGPSLERHLSLLHCVNHPSPSSGPCPHRSSSFHGSDWNEFALLLAATLVLVSVLC